MQRHFTYASAGEGSMRLNIAIILKLENQTLLSSLSACYACVAGKKTLLRLPYLWLCEHLVTMESSSDRGPIVRAKLSEIL